MTLDSVGEAKERNVQFKEQFDRRRLIRAAVHRSQPVILDIGAHRGESARFFRELFPAAFIFSLEPDPDSFKEMLAHQDFNHCCVNMAVSQQSGTATLWRNDISHLNSLLRVNYDSYDAIKITNARGMGDDKLLKTFNHPITVQTITLDDFIALLTKSVRPDWIDLLKIDVQGAEALVLDGGPKTLLQTNAVLIEISLYDFYEKHVGFYDVEKFLRPAGFELFCFTEISHNPMSGRTDWVEALYTRPKR